MKIRQKIGNRKVFEILKRQSGNLDSIFTNRVILTYLVLDKIISGLIDENVKPSVELDSFNTWLNLYFSGDYKLIFNEKCTEVSCEFTVNNNPEPDDNLMGSMEFNGGEIFGQAILLNLINKLNRLNETRPNLERGADYLNTAKELEKILKVLRGISLYLSERFDECAVLMAQVSFVSDTGQISLISQLISIYLDMITGNAANLLKNFLIIKAKYCEDNEFLELKESIYQTIGRYLEESNHGLNKLLHNQNFPNSEKFTLLFSMSISLYLMRKEQKKKYYLKLAEKYAEDIYQATILIKAYYKMGFWKEALHFITCQEKERCDKMVLSFWKARILMTGKRHQESLYLLDSLLADGNEDNVELIFMKGDCLFRLEKYTEGLTCLYRVLELEPENLSALINLGVYYFHKAKDYRQAFHHLLAAEKQGTDHPLVYDVIAQMYDELGLRKKSEEYANKARDYQ